MQTRIFQCLPVLHKAAEALAVAGLRRLFRGLSYFHVSACFGAFYGGKLTGRWQKGKARGWEMCEKVYSQMIVDLERHLFLGSIEIDFKFITNLQRPLQRSVHVIILKISQAAATNQVIDFIRFVPIFLV